MSVRPALLALTTLGLAIGWPPAVRAADDAEQLALGRQVFTRLAKPSCTVCHTLRDAQAEGAVGPVLDDLRPDAARVAKAVRLGIGQMPPFGELLTEAQVAAVARYVAAVAGR